MIFIVIGIIALISIGMALWSLHTIQKMNEVTQVKDDLSKSKILFQHDPKPDKSEENESETAT